MAITSTRSTQGQCIVIQAIIPTHIYTCSIYSALKERLYECLSLLLCTVTVSILTALSSITYIYSYLQMWVVISLLHIGMECHG